MLPAAETLENSGSMGCATESAMLPLMLPALILCFV